VVEILQEFKDHVLSQPKTESSVFLFSIFSCSNQTSISLRDPKLLLPTIISGFQVYFDRSLGTSLLYRFERPQYAEMRKRFVTGQKVVVSTEKEMSEVYGAEHLLRMLGKFLSFLATI
jgi:mortality factor 4-like protein 1